MSATLTPETKTKTLLHIDSSPLGDASISRKLSHEFVENWKQANPNGIIIERDLAATTLPRIDAAWVGAVYTPEANRTPDQREVLAISDQLIAELEEADEIVIGTPMHNFSIPIGLRLWIDQVVRAGKTFQYVDGRPQGRLSNKKAYFLFASGGVYGEGSPLASLNFVEPYLRTIFGFIGVTEIQFVSAGGASAVNSGQIDREQFLEPHIKAVESWFNKEFAQA